MVSLDKATSPREAADAIAALGWPGPAHFVDDNRAPKQPEPSCRARLLNLYAQHLFVRELPRTARTQRHRMHFFFPVVEMICCIREVPPEKMGRSGSSARLDTPGFIENVAACSRLEAIHCYEGRAVHRYRYQVQFWGPSR